MLVRKVLLIRILLAAVLVGSLSIWILVKAVPEGKFFPQFGHEPPLSAVGR